MRLGRQSVTRKRAGTSTDDYGNTVLDWDGATTDVAITGCSVQPGSGSEFELDREASTVVYTVWAPAASDVVETDRVTYAGTDYDVQAVERWQVGSPLDHLVIRLQKVTG